MNDGKVIAGSLAYLTGGDRMTAIISNFDGPDLQPTMVEVWVRAKTWKEDFRQVPAQNVSVSYESGMSRVTFLTPSSEGAYLQVAESSICR